MSEDLKTTLLKSKSETDKINHSILVLSLILALFVIISSLLLGKEIIAQSFLLGVIGSLLYFRMQVLFVKNIVKKDLLSVFTTILSTGRIVIIAGILFIAVRRPDLFDLATTVLAIFSVHLISIFVFFYYTGSKKKLLTN